MQKNYRSVEIPLHNNRRWECKEKAGGFFLLVSETGIVYHSSFQTVCERTVGLSEADQHS